MALGTLPAPSQNLLSDCSMNVRLPGTGCKKKGGHMEIAPFLTVRPPSAGEILFSANDYISGSVDFLLTIEQLHGFPAATIAGM